jgi:hypothetical protein
MEVILSPSSGSKRRPGKEKQGGRSSQKKVSISFV